MNIRSYLMQEASGWPHQGMTGRETGWIELCDLELSFGRIIIDDSGCALEGNPEAEYAIPCGSYCVELKFIEYACDRRVSRLRICSKNVATVLGSKAGAVGVDTGSLIIWDNLFAEDHKARKASLAKKVRAADEKRWSPPSQKPYAVVSVGRGSSGKVIIVNTGFGDGSYPVYKLLSHEKCIGLEMEFIKPDVVYPFEVDIPEEADEELKASEALHWSVIETCWDSAWTALSQGSEATQRFFGQLSPGQRALLAIDIFNKGMLRLGGIHPFFLGTGRDVLGDEILAGYRLLGASEYMTRFERVLTICRPAAQITNPNLQLNAINAIFRGPEGDVLFPFEDWFKQAMKDPARRIERFIRPYIETHPTDFLD